MCRNSLTCMVWQDRKPIHFISNYHSPDDVTTVNRRNKDGSLSEIQMPLLIRDYNSFMGGCDKNDQMTRLYKTRKHYRWPRRLFIKFFMWATYNAYILSNAYSQTNNKYFISFIEEICLSLIGEHRSSAQLRTRKEPCDQRLLAGPHYPVIPQDTSGNHVCVVCSEKPLR